MTQAYQSNLTDDQRENMVELKAVEKALETKFGELDGTMEKMNGQLKDSGDVSVEVKAAMEKLTKDYDGLYDRIKEVEVKGVSLNEEANDMDIGTEFIKSDQYQALVDGKQGQARMEMKTAIINATGQNQPLVPADRTSGIIHEPNRMLRIRDVLAATATNSNLIEFAKENVFTNNAGPTVSGSPEAFENVTKPESGITFTLQTEAVQTIAHWIPASKQVIADSAQLQGYISGRLTYGLKLKEETQLLSGTGANGELNGLITQATAYTVQSPQLTNELDIIREAIKQAQLSEYFPTNIVLNPQDWYDIDVKKAGSTATDIRYIVGNPREASVTRLWGLPVILSNSIASGTFLLGAFDMGAEIKDRMQATVEVSRENSDNFVKNMITILAEERIALVVYRPAAFITGSL